MLFVSDEVDANSCSVCRLTAEVYPQIFASIIVDKKNRFSAINTISCSDS